MQSNKNTYGNIFSSVKRVGAAICLMVLVLQLWPAPMALAAETPVSPISQEDGTLLITQSYPATEEASPLPVAISQEGKRYTLDGTSTKEDAQYDRPKQAFSRTAYSQVPLAGVHNPAAYFPATMFIEEGDYLGEIGLDPASPFTVVNRYEMFRQQVDRSVIIPNLPDNDVTRIPDTEVFEVASAQFPGATELRTLQLLDVQYDIAETDHLGLPKTYTALVTYRGQEEYLELAFYDITAHYVGELESTIDQMVVTGTYKYTPPPPVGGLGVVQMPAAEPGLPLFPLAITGTTVVVFVATPLLYLFFLTNARLIRVASKESGESRARVTSELVCRRRLTLREGVAEFRIPPRVDVLDGALYSLAIKPRLADKEGSVELTWQGKTMAALPLERYTEINFREMLVTSAEAALIESGLLD